ncbi:MAG: transglycosylase, partial [Akkermansiaceae bacterium]|nr:transglycosylase [Akkermansiaceae bacterium]
MPKPNSREYDDISLKGGSSSYRKNPPRPSSGLGSWVLFWPFLIYHWFIRRLPGFIRIPLLVIGDGAIAATYGIICLVVVYGLRARPYDMAKVAEMPERTVVYDRRGEELGRLHGEKRDIIRYEQISPNFLAAILAREDSRFYDHRGVDWYGVGRAMVQNFKRGGMAQGASTLTMQLSRNSFDLRNKLLA